MYAGIAIVVAVVSLVGVSTLYQTYQAANDWLTGYISTTTQELIKESIEKEVVEQVASNIKPEIKKFREEVKSNMAAEQKLALDVIETLRVQFISELEEQKRMTIEQAGQQIEQKRATALTQTRLDVAQTVGVVSAAEKVAAAEEIAELETTTSTSPEFAKWYVIAASSPVRVDIEGELERVKEAARISRKPPVDVEFPNLWISRPVAAQTNFALVIGGPVTLDEAKKLESRAIRYGFRDDTFLSPEIRIK